MLLPCLLVLLGLAKAYTDTRDFGHLCSNGECWNNINGDFIMFAGWEETKAREVCRENRAEYTEYSLPVCLVRRETQGRSGELHMTYHIYIYISAQVSGSWGAWSAWSNCSTGGGIKMRTRQCDVHTYIVSSILSVRIRMMQFSTQ